MKPDSAAEALRNMIWDRIRLVYYTLRLKLPSSDPGASIYYRYRLELMRSYIRSERESEEDESSVPEETPEPGLVRTVDFLDAMMNMVHVGEVTYTPSDIKVFQDRLVFTVYKCVINEFPDEFHLELPISPDSRTQIPFTMDGMDWYWDLSTDTMHLLSPPSDTN